MADFPYSPQPTRIGQFFPHIQNVGRPPKVTNTWLASIGFKSSNDRHLIRTLKALGFIDESAIPKERWMEYRHKEKARGIMAQAVYEAYSPLFKVYPDAYRKDDEALRNFFSSNSSVNQTTISLIVRTFKALVELADFSNPKASLDDLSPTSPETTKISLSDDFSDEKSTQSRGKFSTSDKGYTINVNIQLQLPATNDATIYEKLFEALNKHLLS